MMTADLPSAGEPENRASTRGPAAPAPWTRRRPFRVLWTVLAYLAFLGLNYLGPMGFFFSFLAFASIMAFLFLAFGGETAARAGLAFKGKTLAAALAATALLTAVNYFIITMSLAPEGISFTPHFVLGSGLFYLFTLFQTLNEEIVAGALPLFFLRKKFAGAHPLVLSGATALLFAAAHYVLYRYLFLEKSTIGLPALSALFAVGLVRNNLILHSSHVAWSWALHLSWNLVFFGGAYAHAAGGRPATQAELFNTVMGSGPFLALIGACALGSSLALLRPPSVLGRDR